MGILNMQSNTEIYCSVCLSSLKEPYIKCAECCSRLSRKSYEQSHTHHSCLRCFSIGAETETHSNTHAYVIIHDNFQVFSNSNWSVREERKLLDLLFKYGFGNWSDISRAITSKNEIECQHHYLRYYFDALFEKTCGLTRSQFSPFRIPFLYRPNAIDPPRCFLDVASSNLTAGYRFSRHDFDTYFDNSAESVVSHLTPSVDWGNNFQDVGERLNCALVRAYNNRLRYVVVNVYVGYNI